MTEVTVETRNELWGRLMKLMCPNQLVTLLGIRQNIYNHTVKKAVFSAGRTAYRYTF